MTSETTRVEALEIALSHAEASIDDLSETVQAQWAAIDGLKRDVARLTRKLDAAMTDDQETPPANQPPPHY
jgi:uncharacterized coiled-coil protein SlyX